MDTPFVQYNLYRHLGKQFPTADDIYGFARACLDDTEELFRIYYYDCPPYEKAQTNPVSGVEVNFGLTPTARRGRSLVDSISSRMSPFAAGSCRSTGGRYPEAQRRTS